MKLSETEDWDAIVEAMVEQDPDNWWRTFANTQITVPQRRAIEKRLTYVNKAHWDDVPPSMDPPNRWSKEKLPSPPICTNAEYERDRSLGIVTPIGLKYKPPVDNRELKGA